MLRLLPPIEDAPPVPTVSFCSHCGTRPAPVALVSPSRVCGDCGFGVVLESREDVAPGPGDAFLVLDRSLSVCAVSKAAEQLLATREPDVVNRHVTDLLMPAEAEHPSGQSLPLAVAWAARGDGTIRKVVVRPANTFGIRLTARIGPCGPPQGALLVLD